MWINIRLDKNRPPAVSLFHSDFRPPKRCSEEAGDSENSFKAKEGCFAQDRAPLLIDSPAGMSLTLLWGVSQDQAQGELLVLYINTTD